MNICKRQIFIGKKYKTYPIFRSCRICILAKFEKVKVRIFYK